MIASERAVCYPPCCLIYIKPPSRNEFKCERRSDFTKRAFAAELRALHLLHAIQGLAVPLFYDSFTLEFRNRELPDDRSVHVNMLDHFDAEELSEETAKRLTIEQRQAVRIAVLSLTKRAYEHRIFFPDIGPWNFLVNSKDQVQMAGFESSYDPKSYGVDEKAMSAGRSNSIIQVEDMLDSLGYSLQ
jgi:hypothetical protein